MKVHAPLAALGLVLAAALGCASAGPSAAPVAAADDAGGGEASAQGPLEAAPAARPSRTLRLGVWKLDLVALDLEPRGTTFRLLDVRILKLLEVGRGEDYHSFALLETPGVIEPVTLRREGAQQEYRLLDVQALALLRRTRQGARQEETRVVKPPILHALYGHRLDGAKEDVEYLFVFRQEVER